MPLNLQFGLERRLVDGGNVSLHLVARLDQLEDATPKVFTVVEGPSPHQVQRNIHAVRHVCPHKGAPYAEVLSRAPCCQRSGHLRFRLDDRILTVSMARREFDLNTGRTLCGHGNKKNSFLYRSRSKRRGLRGPVT